MYLNYRLLRKVPELELALNEIKWAIRSISEAKRFGEKIKNTYGIILGKRPVYTESDFWSKEILPKA